MGTPVENMQERNPMENEKDGSKKSATTETINKSELTATEVKRFEEKKISMPELVAQSKQYKSSAMAELNKLVTVQIDGKNVIDTNDYRALKHQIDETRSPEKMKALLDKIQDLPKQREKEDKKRQEEEKALPPDHPELMKLKNKFDQICAANMHLIGTKRLHYFTEWFDKKRKENPTIANLKDIIKRLEGMEVFDKDGLAPRREEFSKQDTLFRKYGMSNPLESTFVKEMGLSGRQEFRQNAEKLEEHFDTVRDTGFYSKEVIAKTMRNVLLAKSPAEQKNLIQDAKNIARKESETFTHLDSKITIKGITIRKMSEASKEKLMQYYKTTNLKERGTLVDNWKKLVENEAQLAKKLEKIYEKHPEELKTAIESFADLDFIEKEKALKEHEDLVNKTESKEELKKSLILKAANTKIDEAARKKIIATGEGKTQGNYKKFFENPDNFKNEKTGKKGNIGELEKGYKILTSPSPNEKLKNLAAYEARRDKYQEDIKKLKDLNPSIKEEDVKEREEKYDREGWTKREAVHRELKVELEKQKAEQIKRKKLEREAGITDSDKEKAEGKETPELSETIRSAMEFMKDGQAAEAMKILLEYNETDPDNAKVLFWIETVGRYMKEFGSGKKQEKTTAKQLEEEVKKLTTTDEEIREEIDEQNLVTLNVEAAALSEKRHDEKKSPQERAEKESMAKSGEDVTQRELTESLYEQTDEKHVINEKGRGEKIRTIKFTENGLGSREKQSLRAKTKEKQLRILERKGFTHVEMKDESGKRLSAQEAAAKQKQDLADLEQKLVEKAEENVSKKNEAEKNGKNVFDLNERIAAKRKAEELIDKERHGLDTLKAA